MLFVYSHLFIYPQDIYYNCGPIDEQVYSVASNPNGYFEWSISSGGIITGGIGTNQISVQWGGTIGNYTIFVYVIENGCFGEISNYFVNIEECLEVNLFIPNAFSPNGDLINDNFSVVINDVLSYQLTIWNRWGELVFETNDPWGNWNGTYKGKESPQDVYTYKVIFEDSYGQHSQVGILTLLR